MTGTFRGSYTAASYHDKWRLLCCCCHVTIPLIEIFQRPSIHPSKHPASQPGREGQTDKQTNNVGWLGMRDVCSSCRVSCHPLGIPSAPVEKTPPLLSTVSTPSVRVLLPRASGWDDSNCLAVVQRERGVVHTTALGATSRAGSRRPHRNRRARGGHDELTTS